MGTEGNTFPSSQRLRHRWEYLHARNRGRKMHTRYFLVYAVPSPAEEKRLGITVSRKVGGAVQRNRVKRMLREYFRQNKSSLEPGTDYSIIAKRGAAGLDFSTLCDDLSRLHVT